MDRPDLQYATKEACREMSKPTLGGWARLKKIARYLVSVPRVVYEYSKTNAEIQYVDVYTDSDWAGCRRTRRSTSGGAAAIAGACVKSWSVTQATIALSSGEAEFNAITKGAAEGLAIQALARDLGWDWKLRVWSDSAAGKGTADRKGLG